MLQLDFILVSHLNNNKTKRHWNRNYRAIDTAIIIIFIIIKKTVGKVRPGESDLHPVSMMTPAKALPQPHNTNQ